MMSEHLTFQVMWHKFGKRFTFVSTYPLRVFSQGRMGFFYSSSFKEVKPIYSSKTKRNIFKHDVGTSLNRHS